MSVREGDMVVTPGGKIGLLVEHRPKKPIGFGVQFVNNGDLRWFQSRELRRATLEEIEASPLRGVGCNQANETTG
jgi:hypothetical protein